MGNILVARGACFKFPQKLVDGQPPNPLPPYQRGAGGLW